MGQVDGRHNNDECRLLQTHQVTLDTLDADNSPRLRICPADPPGGRDPVTGIWGKVVCGLVGLLFGGPLGLLVGVIVGHQIDRGFMTTTGPRTYGADYGDPRRIQSAFFRTTFLVMGHIAKADGRVSEGEIRAARGVMYSMNLSPEQVKTAIRLFTDGKEKNFPLDDTLIQFRRDCHQRRDLFRAFVEIQMQAALAGGGLNRAARDAMWRVCRNLGLSRVELAQIEALVRAQQSFGKAGPARRAPPDMLSESYKVLGIERTATDKQVKTAYRRLMSQHHPDKLVAKGLPESMMEVAKEKTREINTAYDTIKEARGMK